MIVSTRLNDILYDYLTSKTTSYSSSITELLIMKKRWTSSWKFWINAPTMCLLFYTNATPLLRPASIADIARPNPKPSMSEPKPEKLAHDTSMANYRTWMKQFRAYFDAGRLDTALHATAGIS